MACTFIYTCARVHPSKLYVQCRYKVTNTNSFCTWSLFEGVSRRKIRLFKYGYYLLRNKLKDSCGRNG